MFKPPRLSFLKSTNLRYEIRYNVRIIYGTSDAAIDIDELNLNRYNEEFEVDRRVRRLHSDGHTAKHYYQ